ALRPRISRPHVRLGKAHPVQHLCGLPIEAVSELFWIRTSTATALEHACVAANVKRRAAVARRKGAFDYNAIAGLVAMPWSRGIRGRRARGARRLAAGHHGPRLCFSGDSISSGTSNRALTSAIFAAS